MHDLEWSDAARQQRTLPGPESGAQSHRLALSIKQASVNSRPPIASSDS